MAKHADNFGIDKFLRDGSTDFRIGLVVFADQFELDFLAADGGTGALA